MEKTTKQLPITDLIMSTNMLDKVGHLGALTVQNRTVAKQ
jgi:hypothetical protein